MSRNRQTPRRGAFPQPGLAYSHFVKVETSAVPDARGLNHRRRLTGVCGRASRYYVHLTSRYGQFCTYLYFLFMYTVSFGWFVALIPYRHFSFVLKRRKLAPPTSLWIWFLPQWAWGRVFWLTAATRSDSTSLSSFGACSLSLSGKVLDV